MAEIYDTDRFAQLYYPSNTADLLQLGLAARFIASLFEAHQITYAFIGGWAVYLRGGRRRTQDIDITVATTMDHLKQILTAQSRYLLNAFPILSYSLLIPRVMAFFSYLLALFNRFFPEYIFPSHTAELLSKYSSTRGAAWMANSLTSRTWRSAWI